MEKTLWMLWVQLVCPLCHRLGSLLQGDIYKTSLPGSHRWVGPVETPKTGTNKV